MNIKPDPERLKRYKEIIKLLLKYGIKDMAISGDELSEPEREEKSGIKERAEAFTSDLQSLGPTFIKLGQLLSTRPDFLPPEYITALSRLQDSVDPFPFSEIERIIQEELKVRLSKAFSEFNPEPLAAASLGQVHRAKLRTGRDVAVKVQRPEIKKIISEDLKALQDLATSIDNYTDAGKQISFKNILDEFRRALIKELDYRKEADNLIKIRRNLKKYRRIYIPRPIKDYSSELVLTMDFVRGKKITSLSAYSRTELDGENLARELFRAYLDQVLSDGFFHADPHPGNVFITEEKNLALIDLGMVARLTPEMRDKLLRLLLYMSEGKGQDAANLILSIGVQTNDSDDRFISELSYMISEYQDVRLEEINVGQALLELTRISAGNGIRLPSELTMLGKTLLNLDEIAKTLDPAFNPNEEIKKHTENMLRNQMVKSLSPSNIFSSVLELNEFIQKLPVRLNAFFDNIAGNKLSFKIDAIDDNELMSSLQKIANRITLGLVVAALIIGAAMMMQVDTKFTIFGYPGLAIIFFLFAAVFGIGLIINILFGDKYKSRKK